MTGDLNGERTREIEEHIWEKLQFAWYLNAERLGEISSGYQSERSESLAITQLLVVYHALASRLRGDRRRRDATIRAGHHRLFELTPRFSILPRNVPRKQCDGVAIIS
jgi:hypothetical protein